MIRKNKKDMWTTNPEQAKLLLNPDDGYQYTQCSSKKVWWKCPNCGEHLYKTIAYVNKKGLSCNKCSDGISFPNRFMYNTLSQLEVEFITEYIIEGEKYRYDFYLPKYKTIIEMHGRQHYEGWNKRNITKEQIQDNDKRKKIFALDNGILNYIEINCMNSDKNYISKSILNSELKNILDLTKIDWNKSLMNSVKSFVRLSADYYNQNLSTTEIANRLKVNKSTIVNWLKLATELNFCNWSPSRGFLNEERQVILLNNNTVFPSISEASRATNQNVENISSVCKHRRKYSGVDENNCPMIWMFYDEYKKTDNCKNDTEICLNHHTGIQVNQYTLDGEYITTYKTITEAQKITGITTIRNACSKKVYSTGGYRWYYIDDKNQPDKTKISGISRYYGEEKENNNPLIFDVYDRYGNYLKSYTGYYETEKNTGCSRGQIHKCCEGKCAYSGNYVFRYNKESFYKYYFPNKFNNYINVYSKDTNEFVGVFYSVQEALRQLHINGGNSARKALRKERKYAYGYQWFYASDKTQPDKTKIFANGEKE